MSERGELVATGPWGVVDEELLFDMERYQAYSRAHHVAGHAWALWRLGEPLGPVGLSMALPRRLDDETAVDVEASAGLIEALAIEYARELWRLADFGLTPDDVVWDEARYNAGDVWREAQARGCRYAKQAGRLMGDQGWLWDIAWYVVRDWDEISTLADALDRGCVLEADEVVVVRRRRKRSVEREAQLAALAAASAADPEVERKYEANEPTQHEAS